MARVFSLTPREQYDLLLRWGFTDAGPAQGGHIKMIPPGGQGHVAITHPGRPKKARAHAISLKKAAQAVGVSINAFLQGPVVPRTRPITTPSIEEILPRTILPASVRDPGVGGEVVVPPEITNREEPEMANNSDRFQGKWNEWRTGLRAVMPRGEPFTIGQAAEKMGYAADDLEAQRAVGSMLAMTSKQIPEVGFERVGRGLYQVKPLKLREDPVEAPVEIEEPPPPPPPTDQDAPVSANGDQMFEVVRNLGDHRVLMQDERGDLYVAKLQRLAIDL